MAGRYEQLHTSSACLYTEGSPLIISASALLKDGQTGGVIAQVKFQSIDNRRIIAVIADFEAKDISGNPLDGVENFQYLDINVKRDEYFGSKTAVNLPDSRTRQFALKVKRVVFSDNTAWEVPDGVVWTSITMRPITSILNDMELTEQYARDTRIAVKNAPEVFSDLWVCACGMWNKDTENKCHFCRLEKEKVFGALDKSVLKANIETHKEKLRLEAVRRQVEREAKEKRQAEEAAICIVETAKKRKKVITAAAIGATVIIVAVAFIFVLNKVIIPASDYKKAEGLLSVGKYDEAIIVFESLGSYKDSSEQLEFAKQYYEAVLMFDKRQYFDSSEIFFTLGNYLDSAEKCEQAKQADLQERYDIACNLLNNSQYADAAIAFHSLDAYRDSVELAKRAEESEQSRLQANYEVASSLRDNEKYVKAALEFGKLGDYKDSETQFNYLKSYWINFARLEIISTAEYHTVGLKTDGTVVAVGRNKDGQCNVSSWHDIIAISASVYQTVGLKSNGTVVAAGRGRYRTLDVSPWRNIVAISAGEYHTVGLKSDGTVVAVGENDDGQCNVSSWHDIVAVSAGKRNTVGLKSDGTVVSVGSRDYDGCIVSDWYDIISISARGLFAVGLKTNGTVIADIENEKMANWHDIIAISEGDLHTAGLKSDGTVVARGANGLEQCNVSDWSDIVAISAQGGQTVGVKSDGTVVAVGGNGDGQCNVSGWTNIGIPVDLLKN